MKRTDLRGILQYIPRFREKIFILAIDGGIVVDDSLATLLLDVALLRSVSGWEARLHPCHDEVTSAPFLHPAAGNLQE